MISRIILDSARRMVERLIRVIHDCKRNRFLPDSLEELRTEN